MNIFQIKVIEALKRAVADYDSLCGKRANYPDEFAETNGYLEIEIEQSKILLLAEILGYSVERAKAFCFASDWFIQNFDLDCDDQQYIDDRNKDIKDFSSFLANLK